VTRVTIQDVRAAPTLPCRRGARGLSGTGLQRRPSSTQALRRAACGATRVEALVDPVINAAIRARG